MRKLWASALGLGLLLGCGPDGEGQGGQLGLDIYLSGAAVEEIGGFQLALLISPRGCQDLTQTCLRDQVQREELAQFEDASGDKVRALWVPVDLTAEGAIHTQDATLRRVPLGKDYSLVVEAVSRGGTPTLVGASCTSRIEVGRQNAEVVVQPIRLSAEAPKDCSPLIDW